MPLVYVTGISGAGKSAVLAELACRGYAAPGTDEDGIGVWRDRVTGDDVVICLTIDEQTLRRRLARRAGNDFGRDPAELRSVLEGHRGGEEVWRRRGAVMVDATVPVAEVAAEVIRTATR